MLELVDAAFDQMALAAEPDIVVTLDLDALMRRDHRFTALHGHVRDEALPRDVIHHHLLEGQPLQERLSLDAVMALSSGQDYPEGIA